MKKHNIRTALNSAIWSQRPARNEQTRKTTDHDGEFVDAGRRQEVSIGDWRRFNNIAQQELLQTDRQTHRLDLTARQWMPVTHKVCSTHACAIISTAFRKT